MALSFCQRQQWPLYQCFRHHGTAGNRRRLIRYFDLSNVPAFTAIGLAVG